MRAKITALAAVAVLVLAAIGTTFALKGCYGGGDDATPQVTEPVTE